MSRRQAVSGRCRGGGRRLGAGIGLTGGAHLEAGQSGVHPASSVGGMLLKDELGQLITGRQDGCVDANKLGSIRPDLMITYSIAISDSCDPDSMSCPAFDGPVRSLGLVTKRPPP